MEENIVYIVTKDSTDKTFEKDDIIWKCNDGTIMRANRVGWIDPGKCPSESLDFQYREDKRYKVIYGSNYTELCCS